MSDPDILDTIMGIEHLSDEDAKACAWCFGIHKWEDRADLNRQWREFEDSMNQMNKRRLAKNNLLTVRI